MGCDMSNGTSHRDDSVAPYTKPPYDVGYGRPPKHTQFKPGQSGNYKGRPKRKADLHSELCKALTDPLMVSDGGKRRRIPPIVLVTRVLLQEAIHKKDLRAALALLKIAKDLGVLDKAETVDYSNCVILDDEYFDRLSPRAVDEIIEISKQIVDEHSKKNN